MNDDYLWDGSGETDPEVQRLESALGKFRYQPAPLRFPEQRGVGTRLRQWLLGSRRSVVLRAAAVTAVVLLIAAAWVVLRRAKPQVPVTAAAWDVERLAGSPKVGTSHVSASGRLAVGQWLETDSQSRAQITVGEIGQVQVEPGTRLRLVRARNNEGRLALDRGTIQAAIWAPPGQFVVDTPSAVAVDLGCVYNLHVDSNGAGLLRTTLGWVGFRLNGRESFIPAGAACATRPGVGPGTPYFEDASQRLVQALTKLDFEQGRAEERAAELDTVLAEARPRDALTLWHLLSRVNEQERARVYDRLAALVPPPAGVTREGMLRLDKQMLDLWWDQLGLGDTSLWRTWERSWPPAENK